jgi:Zn-dependent protease
MGATNEPEPRETDAIGRPQAAGDPEMGPAPRTEQVDQPPPPLGAAEQAGDPTEPDTTGSDWTTANDGSVTLELGRDRTKQARRRRVRLPLILFITTCLSTFWVGANHWVPFQLEASFRQVLVAYWSDGLIYMACVLAILLTHEMGHFLATVLYRIPASLPYFIPFPISPIGTMGAVIGMDGLRANRKEMFDIGLAGPIAGLLVAVPIMWVGVAKLDLNQLAYGPFAVDLPLIMRFALDYIQPTGYEPGKLVWYSQLNPYFMAGWVGFLITGLNMLPVSQLDGGHVIYTLFGKRAHWIARAFVVLAIAFVVVSRQWNWLLMIALVMLIGPDHPPTSNDNMRLGSVRWVLGCLAISIPLFCFAPKLFIIP